MERNFINHWQMSRQNFSFLSFRDGPGGGMDEKPRLARKFFDLAAKRYS
ncbi:MAG: hypothetical protein ACPLRN_01385 [Microgenomates group bacterium]